MVLHLLDAGKMEVKVQSPNVRYTPDYIESLYKYQTTDVQRNGGGGGGRQLVAVPRETNYTFRTGRHVPRVGVMLVGWGGNNGSTVTAAVLANRLGLSWQTKEGTQTANYYGSVTQASTVMLGNAADGETVHVPLKSLIPMVEPNDIVFDGQSNSWAVKIILVWINVSLIKTPKQRCSVGAGFRRKVIPAPINLVLC